MAPFFSSLCKFCQPNSFPVNRDSGSRSEAKLATSHENEDVADGLKPSVVANSSSQQSTVSHLPSKAKPVSSGCGPGSGRPDDAIGLKLLNAKTHDCKDLGEFQVDVIAVHGLDGHRENTWTYSEGAKQGFGHGPLWLRDFLPQDLPGSRIYTFGYNSKILASQSVSGINDFARQLLTDLHSQRKLHEERPIIFIAHSLGGIVSKEAINLAHDDPEFLNISNKVRGIIFMGTPHKGSNAAWWGTLVSHILFGVDARRDLISALEPDSSTFQSIAEAFRLRAKELNIYSYYEGKKLERYGINKVIVPKEFAILGYPAGILRSLERDHMSMCRFANVDDDGYRSVVNDLKHCVLHQLKKDLSSRAVHECLEWMGRKAGSVRSVSAPQPLVGTCEWFFQQEKFYGWLSSGTQSGLLWVTGDFGIGKTLLSIFLANNLDVFVHSDLSLPTVGPVTVCYFSCDQGFNSEMSIMKMAITLLYQILDRNTDLSVHAIREWEKPGQPLLENFHTFWNVFIATLQDTRLGYTVIIIDAIDECKEETQRLYVDSFKKLLHTERLARKLRILFTSQHSTLLRSNFHSVSNIHLDDAPFSGFVSEDVAKVIKYELDEGPEYLQKDRDFLERSLCEQAGLTYLWVKSVIRELKKLKKRSAANMKAVIDRIPKDLTKHYEQCLIELCQNEESRQDAVKLLKIISASFQPLDAEEISFAVAVSGGQSRLADLEQHRELNIELRICETLGFLVRIADRRVSLIHNSLQRYLESLSSRAEDNQLATFALTTEAAHLEMAKICTKYLSLQDFDIDHFQRTPYSVEDSRQSTDFDAEYSGVDFMFNSEGLDASMKGLTFFDYCAVNWAMHVALAGQSAAEDTGILAAVIKICAKDSSILRNWLGFYWSTLGPKKEVPHEFDPMVVASHFGLNALILCFISKGLVNVGKSGPRALYWAANEGNTSIVKILLSHNILASFKSVLGWTPVTRAAAAGHIETVKALLLANEIEVNEKTSCGRSALSYAIGNGHIEVARLLLNTPCIDVNNVDNAEDTPLLDAMGDGSLDVLRLLLEDGRTNLAHANRLDRTALSYAAEYGHTGIVELLLDQPSDAIRVRLENHRKRSPLLYAVEKGHLEIVKLLDDSKGLDFSVKDPEGFNTVILASKYHHVDVLKYLSKRDPEGFKAVDLVGDPPLTFAFIGNSPRRLQTIDYLLDSDIVDLEHRNPRGRTTLFRAATSNHVEGVRRLIDKGANVNALDEHGWTPLHLVVCEGQSPEMVSCLLEKDADFEIRNDEGLTPFGLAKKLSKSQEALDHGKGFSNSHYSDIIGILARKTKEAADLKAERRKGYKGRSTQSHL